MAGQSVGNARRLRTYRARRRAAGLCATPGCPSLQQADPPRARCPDHLLEAAVKAKARGHQLAVAEEDGLRKGVTWRLSFMEERRQELMSLPLNARTSDQLTWVDNVEAGLRTLQEATPDEYLLQEHVSAWGGADVILDGLSFTYLRGLTSEYTVDDWRQLLTEMRITAENILRERRDVQAGKALPWLHRRIRSNYLRRRPA